MKSKILLFTLLVSLLSYSQIQIGQDIDGEAEGDQSGTSISLSSDGSIVAIGAILNNGNGVDSGQVRVYKNIGGVWTQIGQDIDGEAAADQSGWSLSLSSDGNILAISAPYNHGVNGSNSGHVRVYENINDVWTQIGQDIDGAGMSLQFGHKVNLSSDGNIVALSTRFNDVNGLWGSGQVRVYKNIGGVWTQIGQDIYGEAEYDRSGISLSLSSNGNIVAIGAPHNNGNGDDSGHVRVYGNINDVWTQIGDDIDGEAEGDQSGNSVSLSSDGNILAIGAYNNQGVNGVYSGHVRVYQNINDIWTQIGGDIDGEAIDDHLGFSLSLSSDGSIVAISSPYNNGSDDGSGHVRIYKNIGGVWTQIGGDIDGEAENDSSGWSLSLSSDGSIVVIGAPGNRGIDFQWYLGHVRVYSITSELALMEVIDDITGNSNGINVTASQLNSINSVSGAIEGVNYTTALTNGTFVDQNNPTVAEIQFIIDQVNGSLNVQEDNLFNLYIYPNPSKNKVSIELPSELLLEKIEVFSSIGLLINTTREKDINISSFSSGVYYVKITTNKGESVKKLIIE